jgi:hypothetical protein
MTVCQTGCASSKYYVGDVGTEVLVDVCVDISAAIAVKLYVLKPGATAPVEWAGGVYQLQYIRYVIQAGDLSVAGEYKVQAWVQLPGGTWRGDVATFRVYAPFEG